MLGVTAFHVPRAAVPLGWIPINRCFYEINHKIYILSGIFPFSEENLSMAFDNSGFSG